MFGRIFEKFEDLSVVHVVDLAELVDLQRLAQVLKERFLMLVDLELFDQLLDFVLAYCILLLDCRKRHSRNSVIHSVVTDFPVTLRMILRLGFVDFVDHLASSILARLMALSELSELCGGAPPVSSYTPLFQCKPQTLC